jgi:hypothetical protein
MSKSFNAQDYLLYIKYGFTVTTSVSCFYFFFFFGGGVTIFIRIRLFKLSGS